MAYKVSMVNEGFDYSLMDEQLPQPIPPQQQWSPPVQQSKIAPHRQEILNHFLERIEDDFHARRLEEKGMVIRVNGEVRSPVETVEVIETKSSDPSVGIIVIGAVFTLFKILSKFVG